MKKYFTFGQCHKHIIKGIVYDKDVVLEIEEDNPREKMFELFGEKWSFEYDEPPDMEYFPRGIITLSKLDISI